MSTLPAAGQELGFSLVFSAAAEVIVLAKKHDTLRQVDLWYSRKESQFEISKAGE